MTTKQLDKLDSDVVKNVLSGWETTDRSKCEALAYGKDGWRECRSKYFKMYWSSYYSEWKVYCGSHYNLFKDYYGFIEVTVKDIFYLKVKSTHEN